MACTEDTTTTGGGGGDSFTEFESGAEEDPALATVVFTEFFVSGDSCDVDVVVGTAADVTVILAEADVVVAGCRELEVFKIAAAAPSTLVIFIETVVEVVVEGNTEAAVEEFESVFTGDNVLTLVVEVLETPVDTRTLFTGTDSLCLTAAAVTLVWSVEFDEIVESVPDTVEDCTEAGGLTAFDELSPSTTP